MKEFFGNLKKKTVSAVYGEDGFLEKTRAKLGKRGVPIPITADMLVLAFRRQKENELQNVDVSIGESTITISGLTKKVGMHLYFEIEIKPIRAEGRLLYFQIEQLKPLNYDWLRRKIFLKPPELTYEQGLIVVNLNEWEPIKSLSVGNIQHFAIKDSKLWVRIGL